MNRVAYLETISTTHLESSDQKPKALQEFRRLLGESVANVFNKDEGAAADMLDKAEQILVDRSRERARIWYLSAAMTVSAIAISLDVILWVSRAYYRGILGEGGFQVAVCGLLGAIGALLTTVSRMRTITLNSAAGRTVHYIEGSLRILVGIAGGLFVALLIKANILAGFVNQLGGGAPEARTGALCIAAGYSGRIVPNLISRVENSLSLAAEKATKRQPSEKNQTRN